VDTAALPSEIGPWLAIAKDGITAMAAATGATVAVLGLRAWRTQLKGKSDYERAKRYLRAIYKVRDAIRSVRSIFMDTGEIVQALKEAGVEVSGKLDNAQYSRSVYASRWNHLNAARSELQVEALEAEVVWGSPARDLLRPLNKAIGELYGAIQSHLRTMEKPDRRGWSEDDQERARKIDETVFEQSTDPTEDAFTAKIGASIEAVEQFLRPHLKL
jgi:hypothetical protein